MGSRDAYNRRDHRWTPTNRQRDVLELLVEGRTNAEIAVRLGITVDGAKWHVGELLAETGCDDRQALASWWQEERARPGRFRLLAVVPARWLAKGALTAVVAATVLTVLVALFAGDPEGPPETAAGTATATPRPSPTAWPEGLEALAGADSTPPQTCEPPEAQDLRTVTPAELMAEGLEPAGRVVVAPYCPLYVANRADRAVLWIAGAGIVHFDQADGHRLMSSDGCCMTGFLSLGGVTYRVSAYAYERGGRLPFRDGFSPLDASNGRVGTVSSSGSYLMIEAGQWPPGSQSTGPAHRLAVASDGQVFVDPAPVAADVVVNQLSGERLDVTGLTAVGSVRPGGTGAARTDCWVEEGACHVYLDGLGAAGDGVFNPATMPIPVDGVLSCVAVEGGWNIEGPALAYELDSGDLTLRIGAFGGYWEEWDGGCPSRRVAAGEELEVWVYTSIEAFAPDGAPLSVVATRDGRLFVGEIELELACPCEYRS